jgi:hypothetical protein
MDLPGGLSGRLTLGPIRLRSRCVQRLLQRLAILSSPGPISGGPKQATLNAPVPASVREDENPSNRRGGCVSAAR